VTVNTYVLGRPRPARSRGGDCYAHDLRPDPISGEAHPITERPHVHGAGHVFRLPEHCAVQNGLLRLFVNAGSPPSLTMQVRRGRVIVDDFYVDTYVDLYGGAYSVPEWIDAGVVTIDAFALGVVLTGVRLVDVNPEKVTIKLLAPLIGDAFVTLHRGWRSFRIQHGNDSLAVPAPVLVARRVRLTDSPSPVGTAATGRVEEVSAAIAGMHRFVASTDAVTANAGQFSLTSGSVVTADFGVGVGTTAVRDRPSHIHKQLGNASRPLHLVREAPYSDPGDYGSYEDGY
jgi:hypothetical protein